MSSHTAREELVTPGALAPRRRGITLPSTGDLLAGGRGARALGSAAALFVMLLFFLFVRPLSLMPGYPAVVLAFLVWAIAPGWLVQRALLGARAGVVERVAVAFLMSMGLVALPGVVALRMHWNLETLGVVYALVAAIAGGAALLLERNEERVIEQPARSPVATGPLLALIALPLLAIAASPWWTDTIARDADDWVYMAYVNEYVHHDLDASAPQAGSGTYQRMRANVWVVEEALIADTSGVQPHDLLLSFLPPILTLMAAAATFALAKGLFGRTSLGLMAVAFLLGYALLDLSPHEGFGRNLLLRIGEDKMVASFVLLPVGLLLMTRFIARPNAARFIASVLAGVALFVVHPMGLLFLGSAAAAFALLRAATDRSPATLAAGVALLVPLAALGGVSLGYLLNESQTVTAVFDPRLLFREQFHVNDVGRGLKIGDFHLVLHPLVLAALVAAPLVWLRARREAGAQLVLAVAVAVLLVFFTPPLTTALGKGFSWNAVWRLPWMLPVALTLAIACEAGVEMLAKARTTSAQVRSLALAAGVVAMLSVALVAQEYYYSADGGAFYNRTSSTALLPGTSNSIVLGGVDRAFSGDWRLPAQVERLATYLNETLPADSTVVAPVDVSVFLPGLLRDAEAVGALGSATPEQLEAISLLYNTALVSASRARTTAQSVGIDYMIIVDQTPQADAVRRITDYGGTQLRERLGSPEIGWYGPPNAKIPAWQLDPNSEERLGARDPFAVPKDIAADARTLRFELWVTPAKAVKVTKQARLVVSFFELVPEGQQAAITNVVFDITLPAGAPANRPIRVVRSPSTRVIPGARYGLGVSRLADAPEDTYPDDILLVQLGVRYLPEGLQRITGTPFDIFDTSP